MKVIRRYLASTALAGAGLLLPAAAVSARQVGPARSNTEKLMLSLALGGTSIDSDELEAERESGGGFSAQLGWAIGATKRCVTAPSSKRGRRG